MPLDPGLDLARPDEREVPDAEGLEPPDAEPIDDDAVEVLDDESSGLDLTEPDDGRLIVPSRVLLLTGLDRVPKIGSGADALVAAADHELVVAEFESAAVEDGPADRGTAQLVVDGARTPFTDWSSLGDTGTLAVSVPDDAEEVALEVLFDGVTQRISLLTGVRAEGFPAALYRDDPRTGIGQDLTATAVLPVGDPATAGGVISEARVVAWTDEQGWAPEGKAFLLFTTEGWQTDQPCCEVSGVTVVALFSVTLDGGERAEGTVADSSSQPDPVFVVPAGFTSGSVELRLRVTFERDGAPGSVDGEPVRLAVEVPA